LPLYCYNFSQRSSSLRLKKAFAVLTMSKKQTKKKNKKGPKRVQASESSLVKSLRYLEVKYIDFTSFNTNIAAGGAVYVLSDVPQGTGQSFRTGDFIQPMRWILNMAIYMANTDIVATVCIYLFRWNPSNVSSPPTVANILEAPSGSYVFSHLNFQNQSVYEILWKRRYRCSGASAVPTETSNEGDFWLNVPLHSNPEIEFGLAATSGTNNLYMLAISDSSTTPFPILNFSSRLYYQDIERNHPSKMVS